MSNYRPMLIYVTGMLAPAVCRLVAVICRNNIVLECGYGLKTSARNCMTGLPIASRAETPLAKKKSNQADTENSNNSIQTETIRI